MQSLNKTPIIRSLFIFYVLLVILLGAIRLIEYHKIHKINEELKDITATSIEKEQLIDNILKSTVYRRVEVLKMVYQSTPAQQSENREKIDNETERINTDMNRFKSLASDENEKQMYASLLDLERGMNLHRTTVTQLVIAGNVADAKVIDLNVINPLFTDFQQIELRLGNYIKTLNQNQTLDLKTNLARILSLSKIMGYILAVLLFIFGVILLLAGQIFIRRKNQLIESEKKYRLFMEQTHELMLRVDMSGKILFSSKSFQELLELEDKDLYDLTIYALIRENFIERVKNIFSVEHTKAGIENIKITLISKSGKKIYVQGSLVWEYRRQRFDGAAIFLNKVTEQYELLSKLRILENKFQKIFNQSPLPKYIADAETLRFLTVNKAFLDKYGYSKEEILQKTIMDIRPRFERERTLSALREIVKKGQLYSDKYQHQKKNGEIMFVEIFGSLIDIDENAAFSVSIVDTTEKLLTENRITQAIIKTQEDERYEIGGELHDNVCQILAAAKMNMGLMKPHLPVVISNIYQHVLDSIILANEEIRNLSHRLAPVIFEGSSLKGSLEKLLASINTDNHYNISFYFDEGFEKKSISRELQLNLYRIGQEAIRNIIKYANATEIKVELILYRKNMNLLISDNGVGFDTQKVTAGIGLANIKRRSEFFNGSFSVYSTPGEGCEIVVKIPLQQNNTSGPNSSQIKSIPKELIQMHRPAEKEGV